MASPVALQPDAGGLTVALMHLNLVEVEENAAGVMEMLPWWTSLMHDASNYPKQRM